MKYKIVFSDKALKVITENKPGISVNDTLYETEEEALYSAILFINLGGLNVDSSNYNVGN